MINKIVSKSVVLSTLTEAGNKQTICIEVELVTSHVFPPTVTFGSELNP